MAITETKLPRTTKMTAWIVPVALMVGAATALAFFATKTSTVQEVHAQQRPPAKAQLILSIPPSERGAVASGGTQA